jgi:hypothetical protein
LGVVVDLAAVNKSVRFVGWRGGVKKVERFLLRAGNEGPRFGRGTIDGSKAATIVDEAALRGLWAKIRRGLSR